MAHRRSDRAFTLIEVMVALAIVSVALLAALRAAGQGTSNLGDLRTRLLASWVAENVMAEHRARGDWPAPGTQRGTQYQSGVEFRWREDVTVLPSPAFRRIDVLVFAGAEEAHVLARMSGVLAQSQAVRR